MSNHDQPDRDGKGTEYVGTLFIVKAKQTSLKSAETFLRNRSWNVITMTDPKKLLTYFSRLKDAFVMITVEHNNPKVAKLPSLIGQALGAPVILFSEDISPAGVGNLRQSKHPYILMPPVSGPAIERMILRIKKEREEKANEVAYDDSSGASNSGSDDQGDSVNIVGGKRQNDNGDISISGKRTNSGNANVGSTKGKGLEALASFFQREGDSDGSSASQTGANGAALSGNQSSVKDDDDFAQAGQQAVDRALGQSQGLLNDNKGSVLSKGSRGEPEHALDALTKQDELFAKERRDHLAKMRDAEERDARKSPGQKAREARAAELADAEAQAEKRRGGKAPVFHQAPNDGSSDATKKEQPAYSPSARAAREQATKILVHGTEHALKEASKPSFKPAEGPAPICTNVSCFRVEAANFAGHIVVAFGANREVDDRFMGDLQAFLNKFMLENGAPIQIENTLSLNIEEVTFESWSITEADFLRESVHDTNKVALAFFPEERKDAPLELSAEHHMLKMNISEVRPDRSIAFDLYLHLPTNKKYFRYTGRGRKLMGHQKLRLVSDGVSQIHIRKDSETDMRRYRLQNFLNDKIGSFKKKKRAG